MQLNSNEAIIVQGWLKSRVDQVGGWEHLAQSEIILFVRIMCTNEELFKALRDYESNQNMKYLMDWASNLPQEYKDRILNL
jgi:hypothetical protein